MALLLHNSTNLNVSRKGQSLWYEALCVAGERGMMNVQSMLHNTMLGSPDNIEYHYDCGNDMYRLFLDESMTYSCGIHKPGATLYEASMAKYDNLIRMLNLKKTDRLLDIADQVCPAEG